MLDHEAGATRSVTVSAADGRDGAASIPVTVVVSERQRATRYAVDADGFEYLDHVADGVLECAVERRASGRDRLRRSLRGRGRRVRGLGAHGCGDRGDDHGAVGGHDVSGAGAGEERGWCQRVVGDRRGAHGSGGGAHRLVRGRAGGARRGHGVHADAEVQRPGEYARPAPAPPPAVGGQRHRDRDAPGEPDHRGRVRVHAEGHAERTGRRDGVAAGGRHRVRRGRGVHGRRRAAQ